MLPAAESPGSYQPSPLAPYAPPPAPLPHEETEKADVTSGQRDEQLNL